MDFSALIMSVETGRRYNCSALPDAEIRSDRPRWRSLWVALRGTIRPREPDRPTNRSIPLKDCPRDPDGERLASG
jgi:hypothetical protein